MVVAKSNRRKRQDRVKAGAKRAEQARHRQRAALPGDAVDDPELRLEVIRAASVRGILVRRAN
jgi:hypothetical protein